jgi:indolepyruvate ferredoxin oxidoreductase beta subunit
MRARSREGVDYCVNQKLDIIITGVGGQGTVLASRVLAQAALNAGFSARTSETIGMAQREGSVQSHVRIDAPDFGPLISLNRADILLGFEPAEAQRTIHYLKPGGRALVNTHPMSPVTVSLGSSTYLKSQIETYLKGLPIQISFMDAFELATTAGNYRTVNSVMLGALSALQQLPFSAEILKNTLLELVPKKVRETNERAFQLGQEAFYNN